MTTVRHETLPPQERVQPVGTAGTTGSRWGDPRYQAFWILRLAFAALPLVMGIDKFFNGLTTWPQYLADWIDNIVPGTAEQLMHVVGGVEIAAGLLVLLKPRWAAYIVAAWLAGIAINLFSYGEWYDIAVRDIGLMLGALALARLAAVYDVPLRRRVQ
ncbi:MAG TPA: DoxX family protein [Miltoncostaeaceae bacterium]|nr:DoxX family protein [Miltoncostaeaceae bacterium]